jgi:Flp pilus assembly protein TadG
MTGRMSPKARRLSPTGLGERSQALGLVALLLLVFIGAIGLAVDLGLIYYTRSQVTRAVDAASLAGAAALPDQALATARVNEYLALNDVDPATAVIDFPATEGGESRKLVSVSATKTAPLTILKAFGLGDVTVESSGLGEQASIDIAVVLDISGSMCDEYPGQQGAAECPSTSGYPPGQWRPMLKLKEAAQVFVDAMDPLYDQISLTTYSTRANVDEPLTQDFGEINDEIDDIWPGGYTNIAEGILYGIDELEKFPPAGNAREDAVAVLIVLTDGRANRVPGSSSLPSSCQHTTPNCAVARLETRLAAEEACYRHIVVYSISFGDVALEQINADLMFDVADIADEGQDCLYSPSSPYPDDGEWGNGETENWYQAPTADDLDDVFADIARRIYTRLNR